jgi:hypothetical protein
MPDATHVVDVHPPSQKKALQAATRRLARGHGNVPIEKCLRGIRRAFSPRAWLKGAPLAISMSFRIVLHPMTGPVGTRLGQAQVLTLAEQGPHGTRPNLNPSRDEL